MRLPLLTATAALLLLTACGDDEPAAAPSAAPSAATSSAAPPSAAPDGTGPGCEPLARIEALDDSGEALFEELLGPVVASGGAAPTEQQVQELVTGIGPALASPELQADLAELDAAYTDLGAQVPALAADVEVVASFSREVFASLATVQDTASLEQFVQLVTSSSSEAVESVLAVDAYSQQTCGTTIAD